MFKRMVLLIAITVLFTAIGIAQKSGNQKAAATRATTTGSTGNRALPLAAIGVPQPTPTPTPKAPTPPLTAGTGTPAAKKDPNEAAVLATFDKLLEGIRKANVDMVTSVYWNSPQLVLFNNNGTVTKGWDQMRKNRESSYPEMKDVVLDAREKRVQMLGRDGAVVTCLWTQTQTFRGTPETASGRMTLVFRRVGTQWKAIHLHTSPDAPDPSRIMPSEQSTPATPAPQVTPAAPKPKP